jgi:hypothetical protein
MSPRRRRPGLPTGIALGLALLVASLPAGCRIADRNEVARREEPAPAKSLDGLAEQYVKLALAVGEHDPDYVDAYYGPKTWRDEAVAAKKPLEAIRLSSLPVIAALQEMDLPKEEEMISLRRDYLLGQLRSLVARVEILQGKRMSFDQESEALYDAVSPSRPESQFREILDRLDRLLPGKGALIDRYEAYRKDFTIPREKLDAVFTAAIAEARRRTLARLGLPAGESFTVEYVAGKPWGAYNWYQGNGRSVIQVNTDLPVTIDRALDLAAHEGYPGHHVYSSLLEQRLVRERGWVEFTVYPLFSPQSLIAEGSANFGIEVAFPGDERIAFERDVLFPLAGLDPARVSAYHEITKLVSSLEMAADEAGRRYIDGGMDADQTADYLTRFAMMPPDRARRRVRFLDQYRSYVINYNLGEDLVRAYIERMGGAADQPGKRWDEFARLLSSPRLPSALR